MSTLRPAHLALLAPLLLLVSWAPPAAAETLTCTNIGALPYTIASAGHYCLNSNFAGAYAANAITINASNVVLDCNDHSITQTGTAAVNGIYAANKSLVTVRNCAVVNFSRGIALFETGAGLSRNNRAAGNEVRKSKLAGILMSGSANVVENNRVTENTGGGVDYTYGILLSSFGSAGVGNVLRQNIVTNIAPSLYKRVTGIYLLDVQNTAIIGNTVSALFPPVDLGVYGIVGSEGSLGNAAVNNTVLAATGSPPGGGGGITYGGASYNGILFDGNYTSTNRNVCRGNVVGHWVSNIVLETAGTVGCVKDLNTEF
jgi:parallel beta-helix repeat protein